MNIHVLIVNSHVLTENNAFVVCICLQYMLISVYPHAFTENTSGVLNYSILFLRYCLM